MLNFIKQKIKRFISRLPYNLLEQPILCLQLRGVATQKVGFVFEAHGQGGRRDRGYGGGGGYGERGGGEVCRIVGAG